MQRVSGNRLTLIGPTANRIGKGSILYEWRCTCGQRTFGTTAAVNSGHKKSCGCLHRETSTALCVSRTKHGHSPRSGFLPEYTVWASMMTRCNNPEHQMFRYYGAVGIKVYKRWFKFENFLKDMGERPTGLTLERNKGHLGYSKANCYWATRKQQANNKRSNVTVRIGMRVQTVTQWIVELGLNKNTVWARIHQHAWTPEQALTVPPRPRKK